MERTPTSEVIKRKYVHEILERDAQKIRKKQQKVVLEYNLVRSRELLKSLNGNFENEFEGSSSNKLTMTYFNYARFLDMKNKHRRVYKEGFGLYNRIILGIIYNQTLLSLKYGFSVDIRKTILSELSAAYESMGADRPASFDDFLNKTFN